MPNIFNSGLINKFDHFVFHHKLGSILLTFVIIVATFLGFFIFKPENAGGGKSSFGYLVGIFTQGLLNWPDKEGDYDTYLLVLSIIGTFLVSGFLYAVIANALIGRNDVYKDGKLRYKLADHVIIFGSNSLLESTLDYLNKDEKNKKKQPWFPDGWEYVNLKQVWRVIKQKMFCDYIVVVSSHKPHTIRNRANRYGYIRNHVVIYNDELDDDKLLKKVYLEKAREVYVLGDDEPKITDALNVRLVSDIIKKVNDRCRNSGRLICNVSYFDSSLLMAMLSEMKSKRGNLDGEKNVDVRPYNYLDGCLSFYWCNTDRLFTKGTDNKNKFSLMPKDGKRYHFVIVGFNDLACCCVRKICSLVHYGKEYNTSITMITNAEQLFCYFKEELGVESMPDITLTRKASLKELGDEEDGTVRYYIVATADATMDSMLINHLSTKKHACLFGYAEDYEEEIAAKINYFTNNEQHLGYWGFKKLRTHILVEKQEYNHAKILFETCNGLDKKKDFCELLPMQQMAWRDFYNYLYYLIKISGCKLQSRPEIDKRNKTEKEISAESEMQQLQAKKNTLLSLKLVQDKIGNAMKAYYAAQKALHSVDSVATKDYLEQLERIYRNYVDIVATYLAQANESGMQLMLDIYSYPYNDEQVILYSPIARKILLLDKKDAKCIYENSLGGVSKATLSAFEQLKNYVPVNEQPKVKRPADYSLLTVLPTNRCNFGCSYCYATAGRDDSTIDLPRLKNAIGYFFDSKPSDFNRPLTVSFMGGGEPLMALGTVKDAVEYARQKAIEKSLKLNIRVITNGSLVNDDFIDFCKAQKVEVSVSFDVMEDVQNAQRGEYFVVAQNLTKMCNAGLSVQINTTITPLNVAQMEGMLETIHENWPMVKAVMFEPVSGRMGMDNDQLRTFLETYEKNFITCLSKAEVYGVSFTSFAYLRTVFPLDRACPGEFCVTSHGDITGCYCVGSPKAPLYNETKYGEVNEQEVEFDDKRYRKLMDENVYRLSECADCKVKWNCGGGCYYQRHLYDADYREIQCHFTRSFVQDIILYRVNRYINEHQRQIQLPLLIDNR